MTTRTYHIPNISCKHCTHTIITELSEIQGVISVSGKVEEKTATIEFSAPASEEKIKTVLAEINYPVQE